MKSMGSPLFTGHVTQPHIGPKFGLKGLINGDAHP